MTIRKFSKRMSSNDARVNQFVKSSLVGSRARPHVRERRQQPFRRELCRGVGHGVARALGSRGVVERRPDARRVRRLYHAMFMVVLVAAHDLRAGDALTPSSRRRRVDATAGHGNSRDSSLRE